MGTPAENKRMLAEGKECICPTKVHPRSGKPVEPPKMAAGARVVVPQADCVFHGPDLYRGVEGPSDKPAPLMPEAVEDKALTARLDEPIEEVGTVWQRCIQYRGILIHQSRLLDFLPDEPIDEEKCEHGLSAWLCEGPMHYPADR